jgi:hypothetical protein
MVGKTANVLALIAQWPQIKLFWTGIHCILRKKGRKGGREGSKKEGRRGEGGRKGGKEESEERKS